MRNNIINKQISIEQIIDVADYLEKYKEEYDKKFAIEESRNRNLQYGDRNWEYKSGSSKIIYRVEYQNGQNIAENNYSWFVNALNEPRNIKYIWIDLTIYFFTKSPGSSSNDLQNRININLYFRENKAEIDVNTLNQENESRRLYSEVMNILEYNDERFNKTIKNRKIRMQCFTLTIGFILTYILYFVLKMNIDKLPMELVKYLENKFVLVFGQWGLAILLGNIFSYWYILSIYRPLLPNTKYAGYDTSRHRSKYTDDIDNYTEYAEIQIGKYWDAEKRRNKIEKIYKVTNKIILVQLIISVILFFVIK